MTIRAKLTLLGAVPIAAVILGTALLCALISQTNQQIKLAENLTANRIKAAADATPEVKAAENALRESIGQARLANQRVSMCLIFGGASLVVVIFGFNLWTGRSITAVIFKSIVSMRANAVLSSSIARRIAESSNKFAEGAGSQAASIEETSASLEEISSMTKQNAESAQKANALARHTRAAAERGAEDMQQMSAAMQTIKNSSDEISKIIKTIDEIAFQTNILALNAAVEAARAGESGMGFAVVADEVRNLAQRSALAARETTEKIVGAITNTSRGVELSGKVAETLTDIVSKARSMDELAGSLATASGEQSQGINQINLAVTEVDKVIQGNAAGASENASAAKDLADQTNVLKLAVEQLAQLIGEKTGGDTFDADAGGGEPVIRWNQDEMTTSVQSIDDQHQELIRLINAVHATARKRKGGAELMRQLNFLGEYAQNHFAHEEKIMDDHRCPVAQKNKAAHAKFLRDYQDLVEDARKNGPTPALAQAVEQMLGNWLNGHICQIDTNLRHCNKTGGRCKAKSSLHRELSPAA